MFQTFEIATDPVPASEKLRQLRDAMHRAQIHAYLIPRADEHQGEYVARSSERLQWLTGFSGSAGLAAVTRKSAALFVDGRYTVQARLETDDTLFDYPGLARDHLTDWLKSQLKSGDRVGFDPWLMTITQVEKLKAALEPSGIKLKPTARNLVDRIWGRDRPKLEMRPVTVHPLKYAGATPVTKLADVRATLKKNDTDFAVLTLPDSIAWLFNMRGSDIPHTPVVLSFAIIPRRGKAELFLASEKLKPDVKVALSKHAKLFSPDALQDRLKTRREKQERAQIDPATAPFWFHRVLGSKKSYKSAADPCIALKAIKNAVEIQGSRTAHLRDGVAMARFLAWLAQSDSHEGLDEITVATRLEAFRQDTGALKDVSFDTISGSGPNGAIVHYRVNTQTNRAIKSGDLLLIDSGAQYVDGTTDITRTVAIGTPTRSMRLHYSLVLKGHVAISRARFPRGTRGVDLDPLARHALWQHGLDYDHGTGHGVGSFLSVHEGPQSISRAGLVALEPGMVLSNEPGYYKEGAYGIRIENLILVTEPNLPDGGDRAMMAFETLTLAPYDRALIDTSILTDDERHWVNAYHKRVFNALGSGLSRAEKIWLKAATEPL